MPDPTPIQLDVPCARCGYDLRGLTPPGACPECGHDLYESIRLARLADSTALPADPRWLKNAAEAVYCVLAGFVIAAAVGVRTNTKAAPISAVATYVAWGLTILACWKLARTEPRESGRLAVTVVPQSLRIASLINLLVAAFVSWFQEGVLALLTLTGAAANLAFYFRVRHVALRLGRPGLAGQAVIVGVMSASMAMAVATAWGGTAITRVSMTGWGGFIRSVVAWGDWGDLTDFWRLISWPVVMTACQVAVLLQLLMTLRRARRRAMNAP